jgi:hypothetical protein
MLLFRTPADASRSSLPGVRLAHIHAAPAVVARLSTEGRSEEGCFATVELTRSDTELVPFFLDALQPIADELPTETTSGELFPLLSRVQDLFRSLAEEPRTTALGLWGELFTLDQAGALSALLNAWHNDPKDPVDFISSDLWLEVKTSTAERRRHRATARQLSPPLGSGGYLISILTIPSPTGTSVRDLMWRLDAQIDEPLLRAKLNQVVVKQLGRDLASAMETRFDEAAARASVRLYDMSALPRLPGPIPTEISEIQYVLDISGLEPSSARLSSLSLGSDPS